MMGRDGVRRCVGPARARDADAADLRGGRHGAFRQP